MSSPRSCISCLLRQINSNTSCLKYQCFCSSGKSHYNSAGVVAIVVDHFDVPNDVIKVISGTHMVPDEVARAHWTGVVRELCKGQGNPIGVLGRGLRHDGKKRKGKKRDDAGVGVGARISVRMLMKLNTWYSDTSWRRRTATDGWEDDWEVLWVKFRGYVERLNSPWLHFHISL